MSQAIQPILAMIDHLPGSAVAELERVLRLRLQPRPTAAGTRVAELGYLAELMAELPPPPQNDAGPVRLIERCFYDNRRSEEATKAPNSKRLVERYGSWLKACRAADGLLADGRYVGIGKPWRTPTRGRPKPSPYTREEVRAAIRACALELGCRPTSTIYADWVRSKRARAVQVGAQPRRDEVALPPRLPTFNSISRLYPNGANRWARAVDDAALTDAEIAAARRKRFAGPEMPATSETIPLRLLRQLDPQDIGPAGPTQDELKVIEADGFGVLPLSRAAVVAHALGGSLDWLAGLVAERGQAASPAAGFDAEEFLRRRRERGLAEAAVRAALGLALGPYRRLLSGKDEPSLEQLAILAGTLGLSISTLARS